MEFQRGINPDFREVQPGNWKSPDIREFSWSFHELGVNQSDVALLLGFKPQEVPDPFPEMIEAAFEEAPGLFQIRAGYRIVRSVVFHKENFLMRLNDHDFFTGKTVFSQIRNSLRIALFAATAGPQITDRYHALNKKGESVYSYVLDVLGSVVASKAVDKLSDLLDEEAGQVGWRLSESFSPGFCDWNVAGQQTLFSFFPALFCGISLSSSSLMTPVKSVSGIIGIGPGLNRKVSQCMLCNDADCWMGKIRRENKIC